jgi:hypothetical protein
MSISHTTLNQNDLNLAEILLDMVSVPMEHAKASSKRSRTLHALVEAQKLVDSAKTILSLIEKPTDGQRLALDEMSERAERATATISEMLDRAIAA